MSRLTRSGSAAALACFFLSGFAGLLYEVAWIRSASLRFGSTTFAVSTVLAVFFLGLALGSRTFGTIGQRSAQPMRLFGLLEIGLGLLAAASPWTFALADSLYGVAYRVWAHSPNLLVAARVVCVSLVVLPPTFLMGGPLPLVCRQWAGGSGGVTGSVGRLYALNTLGAVFGSAAAGFVLLPALGLRATILVGATINVLCGVTVLARFAGAIAPEIASAPRPSETRAPAALSLAFFLTGFAALGFQVVWTRHLALIVRHTVHTYALTLTVVLVGIVLGSWIAARLFDRVARPGRVFGWLQVGTALAVAAMMALPPAVWRASDEPLVMAFALLCVPSILSGAAFPLAVRMATDDVRRTSAAVGRMAAVNTLGGIAGSLVVGLVVLPRAGLATSVLIVTGVALAAGFVAWLRLDAAATGTATRRAAVLAVAVAAWLGLPFASGTRLPADFVAAREDLVAFREGRGANLAVVRAEDRLDLEIDRWWQGSNRKNHQVMAAHVPMLLHPGARDVLVVGAGTGQTASRFLMYPIESLACVDLEPAVFDLVREHFAADWLDDARASVLVADGRSHLRHTSARYDVISLEVGQIFRPGVALFYTVDFYRRARARLNEDGLLVQFVPLPFFGEDELRGVLASFLAVFPTSTLWYNTSELLLVGSASAQVELPVDLAARLATAGAARDDLAFSPWGGPRQWLRHEAVFLAGLLCGPDELARLAGDAATYHDDRPVLDHARAVLDAARSDATGEVELARLLATNLVAVESLAPWLDGEQRDEVIRLRRQNLAAIELEPLVRRIEALRRELAPGRVAELLREALDACPDHVEGNRLLGDALLLDGRAAEALAAFARAVRVDPRHGRARYGLAVTLAGLDRAQEALGHYRAALEVLPNEAEIHNNLGVALTGLDRLDEALTHFEQALRLDPRSADVRRNVDAVRQALRQR